MMMMMKMMHRWASSGIESDIRPGILGWYFGIMTLLGVALNQDLLRLRQKVYNISKNPTALCLPYQAFISTLPFQY
jgi:hypothetical protein